MSNYRLSLQAEQDLFDIFTDGIQKWGENKATQYAQQLHDCCELLAQNPEMGIVRKEL